MSGGKQLSRVFVLAAIYNACRGAVTVFFPNPFRTSSATQSAIFAFAAENSKIVWTFAGFLLPKGTGDAQLRPSPASLCSILPVENRAGALRAIICQKTPSPRHPFVRAGGRYRLVFRADSRQILVPKTLGSRSRIFAAQYRFSGTRGGLLARWRQGDAAPIEHAVRGAQRRSTLRMTSSRG